MLNKLFFLLAGLVIAGLALGATGGVFNPGVSASVFRPQLAAAALLFAAVFFLRRQGRTASVTLVCGVLGMWGVLPGYFEKGTACTATCFSHYQKNLLTVAWPRYELADEIIASGAVFVTLQEVSDHNLRFMANLFDHYPNKVFCQLYPGYTVASMTTFDVVPGSALCVEEIGLAAQNVVLPSGQSVWLVSLHLQWPFPYGQPEQLAKTLAVLADLDGPVILGGDLNAVAWSAPVGQIEQATNAVRLGRFRNTYTDFTPPMILPIDHIFVPQGWVGQTELRPRHGSDHHGLLARIGPAL